MPRYRKLHVKTVESLDINDMPDDFTRLLWVLLPLALCREGRGIHNPAWLKSKLFPLRTDINQDDISEAFDWLVKRGMVRTYSVDGRGYFYLPNFHKYQGSTTKEAESDYPPPPDQDTTQVQSKSGPTPDLVPTKSASDSVFSIQYSDADATATADASAKGSADSDAAGAGRQILLDAGVSEPSLTECARFPVSLIQAWAEHTATKTGLHNPPGYLVRGIQTGQPPPNARAPTLDRKRFAADPRVQT